MVRFVKDQPDAYIYSSFGSRIFIGGLLMAVLYAAVGFSAYFYADEVMSLYSSGADIPDLPLLGDLLKAIVFISVLFLPLVSMTVLISRFVLRRTYKKLEQLNVDSKRPQLLLSIARFLFLGCGVATFAPLVMVAESMMTGGLPGSIIGYYQTTYMSVYFTLLGLSLFLVLVSPIVQLYGRTQSRSLIFAGFLSFVACATMIYMANGEWNISIMDLTQREFKSSFGTVMMICGICIFISFWIISRNAKSILRYQKLHFTMKLGE
tara:strand:- start:3149 stop:3940 length:792 start_codon:yes stop_codon:yes gene_type:complete